MTGLRARLTIDAPLTAKDRGSAAAPMAVFPLDLPLPVISAAGMVTRDATSPCGQT